MRYSKGKYIAGYLICKKGADGVIRSAHVVFNNLSDAVQYADKKTNSNPIFTFSVRCQ